VVVVALHIGAFTFRAFARLGSVTMLPWS
jgi:hypothetical protein